MKWVIIKWGIGVRDNCFVPGLGFLVESSSCVGVVEILFGHLFLREEMGICIVRHFEYYKEF